MLVPGMGHVIASEPGPHQDAIESWLGGILAGSPAPPVFP